MPALWVLYLAALALISLLTFCLYGVDKSRARRGAWRIPERILLALSLLGGGYGGALAMYLFRHKTRHIYFHIANIAGILLHTALFLFLFRTR